MKLALAETAKASFCLLFCIFCYHEVSLGGIMARDYKIEIVKGDRVIPVEETGTGRESEHPNIVIRETQRAERELNQLLSDQASSLKGKNK